MKLNTYSPLFAITFAAVSFFSAQDLLCLRALGQKTGAGPSVPSSTQGGSDVSDTKKSNGGLGTTEILSDTRGVNFNPYLKQILSTIYGQWTGLLPDEARTPTLAKGETDIRFTIDPTGRVTAMHLDSSTHDDQLNKAAWGAISGAQQLPPLPAAFTGPNLELRVHFRVNMEAANSGRSVTD